MFHFRLFFMALMGTVLLHIACGAKLLDLKIRKRCKSNTSNINININLIAPVKTLIPTQSMASADTPNTPIRSTKPFRSMTPIRSMTPCRPMTPFRPNTSVGTTQPLKIMTPNDFKTSYSTPISFLGQRGSISTISPCSSISLLSSIVPPAPRFNNQVANKDMFSNVFQILSIVSVIVMILYVFFGREHPIIEPMVGFLLPHVMISMILPVILCGKNPDILSHTLSMIH